MMKSKTINHFIHLLVEYWRGLNMAAVRQLEGYMRAAHDTMIVQRQFQRSTVGVHLDMCLDLLDYLVPDKVVVLNLSATPFVSEYLQCLKRQAHSIRSVEFEQELQERLQPVHVLLEHLPRERSVLVSPALVSRAAERLAYWPVVVDLAVNCIRNSSVLLRPHGWCLAC